MWDFLALCFVVIFLLNPVCFGFLCDASSPPLHCEVAAWLYIPFIFFSPFTLCAVDGLVRENGSMGRERCGDQGHPSLRTRWANCWLRADLESEMPKWRKDWRCWFSKIWDGNCETEKQALTIPPPDIFFGSDRWPGCSAIELVSFQVTHCLLSLFSVLPMTVLLSCNHRWWY